MRQDPSGETMRVLVPYDPQEPKTRLADALSADERRAFAAASSVATPATSAFAPRSESSVL